MKDLGLYLVILTELVGLTLSGVFIGYVLTEKFGAPWWVLVVMSLLGLVLAAWKVSRRVRF